MSWAELGVELKDPLQGLVDFRTYLDGQEAYLCWKLGEDEISWWHPLDGGFDARQSLMQHSTESELGSDQTEES